jgi:uncharacterized protein (TIGR02646 family)
MKYVRKNKEPNSLTQYRKQIGAYFDGYQNKDDLRKSLLKEQKYICCYCMQRIVGKDEIENEQFLGEKMRIEHWQSQTNFPHLQLTYSNLLGACTGNSGQPKNLQHCDVSRGDIPLKINPIMSACDTLIKFKATGEIYSDDVDIHNDLTITLNLNYQTIVKNRKVVLDTAYEKLGIYKGTWSKELLEKEINQWNNEHNDEYKPYCQIVIYHLKKKLAKL